MDSDLKIKNGMIIAKTYRVVRLIGKGTFGQIFSAVDISTGEELAMKVEKITSKYPQLQHEFKVYETLNSDDSNGFSRAPRLIQQHGHIILILDLLGPSLEELFNFCGRQFSLKTVLMTMDQLIARTETLHNHGFIHRDIKPDNFLAGIGPHCNKFYMIDFGLAKKYRDPQTNAHILFSSSKRLIGTVRYASINAHEGLEQSRRDDMEALGYVMVYFLQGFLPW